MHCQLRYFTDGVAFGGKDFINEVYRTHRDHFGSKRTEGARKLRHGEWGGLCSARDLRQDAIVPSPDSAVG